MKIKCDKHKIKFIKQVNLFLNTDGYFIAGGGTVSSTIFNIYLSQDCLGFKKYLYFDMNFVKVFSIKRFPM